MPRTNSLTSLSTKPTSDVHGKSGTQTEASSARSRAMLSWSSMPTLDEVVKSTPASTSFASADHLQKAKWKHHQEVSKANTSSSTTKQAGDIMKGLVEGNLPLQLLKETWKYLDADHDEFQIQEVVWLCAQMLVWVRGQSSPELWHRASFCMVS